MGYTREGDLGEGGIWFESVWDREDILTALENKGHATSAENVERFLTCVRNDDLCEQVTCYVWDCIDVYMSGIDFAPAEEGA